MKRIAKFEKVSLEQFREGWTDTFGETDEAEIREIYEGIRLPKRGYIRKCGLCFLCPCAH